MASQAELNAIKKAIASGVTEVTYDGVTTKYRNLQELREIRDEIAVELGQIEVTRPAYSASFSKGYR